MRYELKMVFPESEYAAIVNRLLTNRYAIREIYHERQINNIYFDSLNYSDYLANMHGDAQRKKYRIRWYGELRGAVDAPVLENKYKLGLCGGKRCLKMPAFQFDRSFQYMEYTSKLHELMRSEKSNPEDIVMLSELLQRNPVLVNSYTRRYFLSRDMKYRITLDKNLWYANLTRAKNGSAGTYEKMLVLEVKFDTNEIAGASELINALGYRIERNSKFVNGINAVIGI